MKKDHVRDYATDAFRYYASIGKTFEQVKEEIYQQALEESKKSEIKTNNICSPTELAMMRADKAIIEKKGELEDLLAVEETLKKLPFERNGKEIKEAIELVYFADPTHDLERNDISNRVTNAAMTIHCDTSTIYRYLAKARSLFAENRGLRVSKKHITSKSEDANCE